MSTGEEIATPAGVGGLLARFTAEPALPGLAARAGAWAAGWWGRPFRFGHIVVAARHADVEEMLARDLDFRVGPVNAARMDAVNGPFVLGMDRSAVLAKERRALYTALAEVDLAALRGAVSSEAASRIAAAPGGTIDVVGGYARPIAAHTAHRLFGIAGPTEVLFMDVARAIFAHTFLNIGGDKVIEARALKAATLMREWFTSEIARRREAGELGTDFMGALLRRGALDDDGVRRMLGGMLVGSIDTTATSVAKIVATIAGDPSLARNVAADVDNAERLAGWCHEALRRWPHNPILLRRAAAETRLGDVTVHAGDTVVGWTQAAMLDAGVFPEPRRLRPDRPPRSYLHFGGGLHPCAGRAVNAFQIPLLVEALVRHGIGRAGAVQWAGPFPDRLDLTFARAVS